MASERCERLRWLVRPMRPEDIDKCLLIWKRVELTEASLTVASALATDPAGFWVAELFPTGEVIGMCAGPMTRADTAFMGFYAVDPDFQGIGIGRELWAKTMERLATINTGLYGVPAMSQKYKKAGFGVEDSISMLIFESIPDKILSLNRLANVGDSELRLELIDSSTSEVLFQQLVDYDCSVQGFSREQLLRNYLRAPGREVPLTFALVKSATGETSAQHPVGAEIGRQATRAEICGSLAGERKSSCCARPSQRSIAEDGDESCSESSGIRTSLASALSASSVGDLPAQSSTPVDVTLVTSSSSPKHDSAKRAELRNGDVILGYGCVRADNTGGGMVGPIYADSESACETLLGKLLAEFELQSGAKFSIMPLSSNKHASEILRKIGLVQMDTCSRMFTRFIPEAEMSDKIYYVHSPNFTLF